MVSTPGPGMWDFGLVCLIFKLELVCLFSLFTWLSVDVICFFSVVCLCPGCGLKFLDCVVVNQVFLVAGCCPGP